MRIGSGSAGNRLRRLIALALHADPETFEPMFDRATFQTGMVHYAAAVSDPGQAVFGIRPHADGGIFTILVNDGAPLTPSPPPLYTVSLSFALSLFRWQAWRSLLPSDGHGFG